MLVLKRTEGQWLDVIHVASGDVVRIRTCDIGADGRPRVNLVVDDAARNFAVERPERATPRRGAETMACLASA